jgi:hypothetical protein
LTNKNKSKKIMRKNILLAITYMLFSFVNAQEVKFGIKGGLNLSSWAGDTKGLNLRPRFGVNVGSFAEIRLTEQFAIQPEVLYATQGTKFKNVGATIYGTDYIGDIKWNLSYINIPVMFKYSGDGKSFIEAGPQIGFLTSAKAITKLTRYSQTVDQDVKEMFESLDFGFVVGVGLNITKHLLTDLRYNIGLSNIIKTESDDNTKIRNSVLSLSLGYKF